MKKILSLTVIEFLIILLIIGVFTFFIIGKSFSDDPIRGRLNIEELDSSPSVIPYKFKVPNDTLIDNSDGTATLNILNSSQNNSTYLKLDGSNDPMTGDLSLGGYNLSAGNLSAITNLTIFNGTANADYLNITKGSDNIVTFSNRAGQPGGGNDAYTSLLLHMDGADASTTFTDVSVSAHSSATVNGDAQVDTTNKQLGTGSLQLDGTGDWIYYLWSGTTPPTDWTFGTGDFTIDFWFRLADATAEQSLCSFASYTGGILIRHSTSNTLNIFIMGSNYGTTYPVSVANNTFYHLEVSRSGTTLKAFLNGSQFVSTTCSDNIVPNSDSGLYIGTGNSQPMNGYIDEFRVSKGIARHTTTFTPETLYYGESSTVTATPLKFGDGVAGGEKGTTYVGDTNGRSTIQGNVYIGSSTELLKTTSGLVSAAVEGTDYAGIDYANNFTANQTISSNLTVTDNVTLSKIKPASDSTTAIQITNSTGTNILNFDTTNGFIGLSTNSPTAALEIQENNGTVFIAKRTSYFDNVQYWLSAASGTSPIGWSNITDEAQISFGTVSGDILGLIGDYFYTGKTVPYSSIYMDIGTVASTTANRTYEYSIGGGNWSNLSVTDGTVNFSVDGSIEFTPPANWTTDTVNNVTDLYWVRAGTATGTFSVEPTVYLVVPDVTTNPLEVYANNGDTIPSLKVNKNGAIGIAAEPTGVYRFYLSGTSYLGGAVGGVTTLTTSGANTNTINPGYTHAGGFITQSSSSSVATALLPLQHSPVLRLSGKAWNGTASTEDSMDIYVKPSNVNTGTTSARMIWKDTIINGTATNQELMSLSSAGSLEVIGSTEGSEVFTDGVFDTGATNWSTTGDWAYSTNDYTFTYSTGAGTITQSSAKFATALIPNAWYKFSYVVGVAGPTGTLCWIGTEIATENVYFTASTTEVNVFFKTNAAPADFVLYTTANTTSGMRLDSVSLKEITGGSVGVGIVPANNALAVRGSEIASGAFSGTANHGIARIGGNQFSDNDVAALDFGFSDYINPVGRIGLQGTTTSSMLKFGLSNNFANGITGTVMTLIGDSTSYRVGIGTTAPNKALEINSATGACMRQTYNDADGSATNYVDYDVSSSGDSIITPSGGDTNNTGNFSATGTLAAQTGNSTNQAICWKANGILGYCSSVVGVDGSCTCN